MSIKELYAEGRRFKVVKEGARFEGLLLFGEASMSGWSRTIERGEILTCLGWQEVDVFGMHVAGIMWSAEKVPDNAMVVQVWPFESLFRPFPLTGFLEPYVEPTEEEDPEVTYADVIREEAEEQEAFEDLTRFFGAHKQQEPEEEDEIVDLTQH